MADAPALSDADNRRQDLLCQGVGVIDPLEFSQAPITRVARVVRVVLTEILYEHSMSASGAASLAFHIAQEAMGRL